MNLTRVNNIRIRKITLNDAVPYMKLLQGLDNESNFLFFETNERSGNVDKYSTFINKILSNEKSVIFVAETNSNELIGFICGEVLNVRKKSHLMTVSFGVSKKYQLGLGRRLIIKLADHIRMNNIKKIEGYVMETNKKCLNLVRKFGGEIEGIKRSSIRINNEFINEYIVGYLNE